MSLKIELLLIEAFLFNQLLCYCHRLLCHSLVLPVHYSTLSSLPPRASRKAIQLLSTHLKFPFYRSAFPGQRRISEDSYHSILHRITSVEMCHSLRSG